MLSSTVCLRWGINFLTKCCQIAIPRTGPLPRNSLPSIHSVHTATTTTSMTRSCTPRSRGRGRPPSEAMFVPQLKRREIPEDWFATVCLFVCLLACLLALLSYMDIPPVQKFLLVCYNVCLRCGTTFWIPCVCSFWGFFPLDQ